MKIGIGMLNRERERARARELYSKYKVIRRITNRVSYRKRKERILEYRKSFIKNTKIQVISHYSQGLNKCALCDEKRLVCLTIDHIKGGGNKHRKEIKVASGTSFARWLIVNNFPEGYRILCMNCQFAEVDRLRKVKYHGEE